MDASGGYESRQVRLNFTYNFGNNTGCTWEGRSCNGLNSEGSGRGVIFYGEKGRIVYLGAN